MNRYAFAVAFAAFVAPLAARAELPADTVAAIAKMGHVNDTVKTAELFAAMHHGVPSNIRITRDLAFGTDPAQKLDVFTSGEGAGKPILVYVHGGGFTRGDKHNPGEFMYDNVMAWAVQNGMVGVNTNYRLAPASKYPAANDDVAASVKFAREHAREFGGDPNKIIVWGHSAGASLVAIMVSHPEFVKASGGDLAGAIITSGQYEFSGKHPYLGDDQKALAAAGTVDGMKKTNIPLLFTRAEWDMDSQMAQGDMINKVLCDAGKCPTFRLMKGHNHMSQVYSIGTAETQLTEIVLPFIRKNTSGGKSASN